MCRVGDVLRRWPAAVLMAVKVADMSIDHEPIQVSFACDRCAHGWNLARALGSSGQRVLRFIIVEYIAAEWTLAAHLRAVDEIIKFGCVQSLRFDFSITAQRVGNSCVAFFLCAFWLRCVLPNDVVNRFAICRLPGVEPVRV